MIDRRTFLQTVGALAAGAACASGGAGHTPPAPARKKMTILILGGTGFIGPHIVEEARAHGHTVTLFNRGKTNPGLFPDVEKLHGDRDGDLKALEGRKWDAVIDPSGYVPRVVRASADLLAPSVGHYVFISTISVYDDAAKPPITESSPLAQMPAGEEKSEEVKKYYGALKALCEKEVAAVYPGRSASIRPGLIVGPRDQTDRFSYWPVRIDRGGEVLAPGDGSDPVQFIDGRDLASWVVRVVEERTSGTFNAVGPAKVMTMRELVESCQRATTTKADIVWVSWPFLEKKEVAPWSEMPVWVPKDAGFSSVSAAPAIAKGLTFRPVDETVRDTLAFWRTLPEERREKLRAGITPEKEKEVIAAWRASGGKS